MSGPRNIESKDFITDGEVIPAFILSKCALCGIVRSYDEPVVLVVFKDLPWEGESIICDDCYITEDTWERSLSVSDKPTNVK